MCFEGVIANWSTQDPGAVLGKLHVIRETQLHEVISGELKGGGKDATLVAPQLTLKVLAVEVSPAAVGFKHSIRLSNQMYIITISKQGGEIYNVLSSVVKAPQCAITRRSENSSCRWERERWMAREKRKLPREHPCLQPTEFMISQRPELGSWKRTLEASPYMSLARL